MEPTTHGGSLPLATQARGCRESGQRAWLQPGGAGIPTTRRELCGSNRSSQTTVRDGHRLCPRLLREHEPGRCGQLPRLTAIEDDVARWFEIYDVDGIFIDQASGTDVARGGWLTSVVQSQKSDAVIVLNPGTIPPRVS